MGRTPIREETARRRTPGVGRVRFCDKREVGDAADMRARGVSDLVGGATVSVKWSKGESGPTFRLGRPMSEGAGEGERKPGCQRAGLRGR